MDVTFVPLLRRQPDPHKPFAVVVDACERQGDKLFVRYRTPKPKSPAWLLQPWGATGHQVHLPIEHVEKPADVPYLAEIVRQESLSPWIARIRFLDGSHLDLHTGFDGGILSSLCGAAHDLRPYLPQILPSSFAGKKAVLNGAWRNLRAYQSESLRIDVERGTVVGTFDALSGREPGTSTTGYYKGALLHPIELAIPLADLGRILVCGACGGTGEIPHVHGDPCYREIRDGGRRGDFLDCQETKDDCPCDLAARLSHD